MTDILQQSPPKLLIPSAASLVRLVTPTDNDGLHQESNHYNDPIISTTTHSSPVALHRRNTQVIIQEEEEEEESISSGGGGRERKRRESEEGSSDQLSILAVFVTVFRKSLVACNSEEQQQQQKQFSSSSSSSSSSCASSSASAMEISWPTNVRHVAHVTFDRFNGFLGLPVEFEPEVPRRPPSASIRVFGVSTESMQLSFDSRGNCVPTILLMMQRRLYLQGGLQAEGIFRINAENGQEEYVREQLNSGVVPDDIDVHCLAGLVKAWFRELPRGVLDSLSPDEVMQAQTEEECERLVRLLPSTEAALLDWAINLMADVAQFEHLNKMNARNVAMVFAPNMTQMADPLTALMYAVQVMNFLKTLIVKTLREREDPAVEAGSASQLEPFDENGHQTALQPLAEEDSEVNVKDQDSVAKEPPSSNAAYSTPGELKTGNAIHGFFSSVENILPKGKGHVADKLQVEIQKADTKTYGSKQRHVIIGNRRAQLKSRRTKTGQSSDSDIKKASKKIDQQSVVHVGRNAEKSRENSITSRLNRRPERVEAWR